MLRSSIDSIGEAKRILDKYNERNPGFLMSKDDLYRMRTAASMAHQAAKSLSELSGYLEHKFFGEN
jgi:hypothetical protein